jgi:hypothetical protein
MQKKPSLLKPRLSKDKGSEGMLNVIALLEGIQLNIQSFKIHSISNSSPITPSASVRTYRIRRVKKISLLYLLKKAPIPHLI